MISLERLKCVGGEVTVNTYGKVLVLPTENAALLPSFNEYTLNSNRLTIAESPFGGLKGSGSPDYAPGTLNVISGDGIYLQDTFGLNSAKTLTAGKLKELNLLSVDTTAHTITEEFIVANTATNNNPNVVSNCDVTTSWSAAGSGTISLETTDKIEGVGAIKNTSSVSGELYTIYNPAGTFDFSTYGFLCFSAKGPSGKSGRILAYTNGSNYRTWTANYNGNWQVFVLPLKKGTSNVGTPNLASIDSFYFDVLSAVAGDILLIDNIFVDVAKSAYIELQIPNNLAATSTIIQCYSGSTYSECRRDSLDSTYSNVSSTPENMKFLDGTKFDDVYGSGLGRAYFPKGLSGETKAGSSGNITYSANKGTRNRIGFRFDLPPSDGGRTLFNCLKVKIISNYAADTSGKYLATYDFADSTNASYGLQNLSKPWIALYDPASNLIDFYLFTHRPKNLQFKRDESGTIYEITLYPGNGLIYHGQVTYAGLTTDSDSNLIPNCLEASVEGSVTKFLQSYGMVI